MCVLAVRALPKLPTVYIVRTKHTRNDCPAESVPKIFSAPCAAGLLLYVITSTCFWRNHTRTHAHTHHGCLRSLQPHLHARVVFVSDHNTPVVGHGNGNWRMELARTAALGAERTQERSVGT